MKTLVKILFVAIIAYLPMTLSAQADPNAPLYAETTHGAISIGAGNPWNAHFSTDVNRFWFNRPLWVNTGKIGSYGGNLDLQTHAVTRMTILKDNGFVGIGGTNPKTPLHVTGLIRSSYPQNSGNYIELTHGGGNSCINHVGVGRMDFRFNSANKMVLTSEGRLGIGLDVPQTNLDVRGTVRIGDVPIRGDYKLYVETGILAERVRVASKDNPVEWADYVFESDYDLNSIEEVETFVKTNKHLPNVPSAKEVAEKGVDIVEMDATLLRQIEELWLHTIQLNERIQELEKQLGEPGNK